MIVPMGRATIARVALTGAALAVALVGCAGQATTASPGSLPTGEPQAAASAAPATTGLRVAIVGDSLTAGGGRLLSDGLDADTWMTYAQGDGVDYVGGWAKGGSTVQEQAAAVRPIADVDVLVLMSGTNDVRRQISFADSRSSYESIIDTIDARHVVIAAIPPYDRSPVAALRYEADLERWVATTNHTFVDPWGFARDGAVFARGTTDDGVHPTTSGYRLLGTGLREAILDVGRRASDAAPTDAATSDPVAGGEGVVTGS